MILPGPLLCIMETQFRNGAADIHNKKYNVLSLDRLYGKSLVKFTMQMKKKSISEHLSTFNSFQFFN
jgi:hypothetical protein